MFQSMMQLRSLDNAVGTKIHDVKFLKGKNIDSEESNHSKDKHSLIARLILLLFRKDTILCLSNRTTC